MVKTSMVQGEIAAWASVPSFETITKSMKPISIRETVMAHDRQREREQLHGRALRLDFRII